MEYLPIYLALIYGKCRYIFHTWRGWGMAKCDIMSLLIRAKTCRIRIDEWQIGATCIVQVCGSGSSGHTITDQLINVAGPQ